MVQVVDTTYVLGTFLDTWIVSAAEGLGSSHDLDSADLLSATIRWEMGLIAPLVQGMPYVTLDYGSQECL